jgi:hypothetical protein
MELWPENDTDEEDQEHQEHQELEYQDDIADMSVWSPFVQHYGDQLKSFGLQSLQNEPDLITEMDQAGCRLGKLSVYNVGQIPLVDLLSQSKQCTYIQELVLLNINNNMPLEPLQQMTCLGTLKMSFTKKCGFGYINFNRLLNICCDRLTSLMLENLGLELDTDVKQQYGLKKLELNSNDLPDGFVSFLSHHIQNLRHLTLSGRLPLHMSLDLPKLHLSSFNLKKSSSEGTLYFSIVSLADKTSRSYASCHYDENDGYLNSLTETYGSSVCAVMPPTCLDLSSHKQTFVLVCASVQNVILNNYLAC